MSGGAVLLAWADDLTVHGSRLARWITDYVDLEESLAAGSIAQQELAHAATLLELCGLDPKQRDALIFERGPASWSPSQLTVGEDDDWPASVAESFLLTHGVLALLDELGTGETVQVMRAEQRLHATHWERWVALLAAGDLRDGFLPVLEAAVVRAGDLFGEPAAAFNPPAAPQPRIDLDAAHVRWAEALAGRLADLGLPPLQLPPSPQPRQRGDVSSVLVDLVATMRSVRTANPDFTYAVYQ